MKNSGPTTFDVIDPTITVESIQEKLVTVFFIGLLTRVCNFPPAERISLNSNRRNGEMAKRRNGETGALTDSGVVSEAVFIFSTATPNPVCERRYNATYY